MDQCADQRQAPVVEDGMRAARHEPAVSFFLALEILADDGVDSANHWRLSNRTLAGAAAVGCRRPSNVSGGRGFESRDSVVGVAVSKFAPAGKMLSSLQI